MAIQEVLAKVVEGKDLTDDEKKALKEYREPDVQAEVDKKAKAIKREAEDKAKSKVDELQELVNDLQGKLEERSQSGLSEVEKMKKDLEKAQKAKSDADAQLEKMKTENANLARNHRVDAIFSELPFIDGVDKKDMRTLFGSAVGETDLDSEDAVKDLVTQFKTRNKALISANVSGGAGTGNEPGGVTPTVQQDPMKQSDAERQKHLSKSEKVWS